MQNNCSNSTAATGNHSTKVILTQELECDEENKGVNKDKSVIFEQTQDITDNSQPESVDKLTETRRTSTRNKKIPNTRGNDLW
jgi:hypothetical protein